MASTCLHLGITISTYSCNSPVIRVQPHRHERPWSQFIGFFDADALHLNGIRWWFSTLRRWIILGIYWYDVLLCMLNIANLTQMFPVNMLLPGHHLFYVLPYIYIYTYISASGSNTTATICVNIEANDKVMPYRALIRLWMRMPSTVVGCASVY